MSTTDGPQFCKTCLHHFPTLNDFEYHRYAVSARQCINCYTGLRFPNRCEYLQAHEFYGCREDPPKEPSDRQGTRTHTAESETPAERKYKPSAPHCQACQLQDLSSPAAVEYHEINCKPGSFHTPDVERYWLVLMLYIVAALLPARYCGPCALLYSTTTEIHQRTALHLQHTNARRTHWRNVNGPGTKGEAKFECTSCGLVAPRRKQMKDHETHTQYLKCRHCEQSFATICKLSKHLQNHDGLTSRPLHVLIAEDLEEDAPKPAMDYRCCDCQLTFTKRRNFKRHVEKCKLIVRPVGVVCQVCGCELASPAIKIRHLNYCKPTPVSKPTPVKCAGKGCEKRFRLAAHMIQHLESGGCVSGFDKNEIHGLISKHDPGATITIPTVEDTTATGRNAESPTGPFGAVQDYVDDDSDTEVIYTPSTSGILTPASGFSTGTTLSFPLQDPRTCPVCCHTFATVKAAAQHRSSPVHDPPRYQCPSTSSLCN